MIQTAISAGTDTVVNMKIRRNLNLNCRSSGLHVTLYLVIWRNEVLYKTSHVRTQTASIDR